MTWAARAEALADDLGELGGAVTSVNAAAWRAGVDPEATAGLSGAARALGARPPAFSTRIAPLPSDREMLGRAADLEADAGDMLRAAQDMRKAAAADWSRACDELRAVLAAQRAARSGEWITYTAIAASQARIADCEVALEMLAEMIRCLAYVLTCLSRVPDDLATAYEVPYRHIRRGGVLPAAGDWLTGLVTAGERNA